MEDKNKIATINIKAGVSNKVQGLVKENEVEDQFESRGSNNPDLVQLSNHNYVKNELIVSNSDAALVPHTKLSNQIKLQIEDSDKIYAKNKPSVNIPEISPGPSCETPITSDNENSQNNCFDNGASKLVNQFSDQSGLSVSSVKSTFLPSKLPSIHTVPIKEMIPGSKLVPMYLVVDSNVPHLPSAYVVMNKPVSDTSRNETQSTTRPVVVENQLASPSVSSKTKVVPTPRLRSLIPEGLIQSLAQKTNATNEQMVESTTLKISQPSTDKGDDKCQEIVKMVNEVQIPSRLYHKSQIPSFSTNKEVAYFSLHKPGQISSSEPSAYITRAQPCVKNSVSSVPVSVNNQTEIRNIPVQQNQRHPSSPFSKSASFELAVSNSLPPTSDSGTLTLNSTNLHQTDINFPRSDISVRNLQTSEANIVTSIPTAQGEIKADLSETVAMANMPQIQTSQRMQNISLSIVPQSSSYVTIPLPFVKNTLPSNSVSGLTLSDGVTPMSVISPRTFNQVSQSSPNQISPRTFHQIQNQSIIPGYGVQQSQPVSAELSVTKTLHPAYSATSILDSKKLQQTEIKVSENDISVKKIEPHLATVIPTVPDVVTANSSKTMLSNVQKVKSIPTTMTDALQTKITPGMQYISQSGMPQWVIPPNTTVVPQYVSSPQMVPYVNFLSGIAQTPQVLQNPNPMIPLTKNRIMAGPYHSTLPLNNISLMPGNMFPTDSFPVVFNHQISHPQNPIPPSPTFPNQIQIQSEYQPLDSNSKGKDSIKTSSGCQGDLPKNKPQEVDRNAAFKSHIISNKVTEDPMNQESLEDEETLEEEKVTFPYTVVKKQRKKQNNKKKSGKRGASTTRKKGPKAKADKILKRQDGNPTKSGATDIEDKGDGPHDLMNNYDPAGDAEVPGEFVITENQQVFKEDFEDDWNSSDDEYVKRQKEREDTEDLFNPNATDCSDREALASLSAEEDEDEQDDLFKGRYVDFIGFTKALELMFEVKNDKDFFCKKCGDSFNSKFEAKKHLLTHRPYKCVLCDLTFPSLSTQQEHLKTHTDRFCCVQCTYSTSEERALGKHVREKHGPEKHIQQPEENPKQKRKRKMKQKPKPKPKLKLDTPAKTWMCDTCGIEFPSVMRFQQHLQESHGSTLLCEGVLECPFCKKIYSSNRSLKEHFLFHKGKVHKCDYKGCGFESLSRQPLTQHIRTKHMGERYICTFDGCNKEFSSRAGLQTHTNTVHIKDRNCVCVICGKKFLETKHLNVHILIHTDSKPLGCQYCDYRCRQRAAMDWHMKKKHPDKEYVKNARVIGRHKPGRKPTGRKRRRRESESSESENGTTRQLRQSNQKKPRMSSYAYSSGEEVTDVEDRQKVN